MTLDATPCLSGGAQLASLDPAQMSRRSISSNASSSGDVRLYDPNARIDTLADIGEGVMRMTLQLGEACAGSFCPTLKLPLDEIRGQESH